MKAAKALAARVLPRTLAGRVLLIILGGLVIADVASFTFLIFVIFERGRVLERFAAEESAARIMEMVRAPPPATGPVGVTRMSLRMRWRETPALEAAPAGEESSAPTVFASELRRLLAESLGGDPVAWVSAREAPLPMKLRTSFRPPPGAAPGGAPAAGAIFAGEPRHLLAEGPGDAPVAWISAREAPIPARPAPGFGPPAGEYFTSRIPGDASPPRQRIGGGEMRGRLVTIGLRLPQGRFAVTETMVVQPSMTIPADVWISMALIFLTTAAFSVVAVRLAMQPVRMLAGAANRLSRNIDEPPLAETGTIEVITAARAFNRMQDRLRRHVKSRALAFAAMSHDVRTPITRMRLRLESLPSAAREKLSADLDEIEGLSKAGLELTRGISPEEPPLRVDLDDLVRQVSRDYAAVGKLVPVTGRCGTIKARPLPIRRTLVNLVDNALEYGKEVAIELTDGGDHVCIDVRDRGPGIPPADLDKVVHPFYRVEPSRNRETGGTGLGLAIAKDIVEAHGGELEIANREGGGLQVTVRLPR